MDRNGFQDWLDRYVEAWKSYDPQQIGDLFSEDAEYRYHPQDEPLRGRDAIVANWTEDKDDQGTYDAKYEVAAIDGDTYVATGHSDYFDEQGNIRDQYLNVYFIKFNDAGEATEFTEYWIQNRDARRRALEEIKQKAVDEAGAAATAA
jgi:nuclear transport factor 2 (NTF2) superfamily protein